MILLALACLPKYAVSGREQFPADQHVLELTLSRAETTTYTGSVWVQYTRTFRDGSLARLVVVQLPGLVDGAWVELRSFNDGRILDLANVSAWPTQGVPFLDDVWHAVNPLIQGRKREIQALWVQPLLRAAGVVTQGAHDDGGYTVTWPEGERAVTLDPRTVRSTQTLRCGGHGGSVVSAVRLGPATPSAPVALDMPLAADDPSADALPLRLAAPLFGVQQAQRHLRPCSVSTQSWLDTLPAEQPNEP